MYTALRMPSDFEYPFFHLFLFGFESAGCMGAADVGAADGWMDGSHRS
jgi:hypothetical protein